MGREMAKPPVMIVTGGARGIGAATAKLAEERGYAVCVNYQQDRDSAEEVVHAIVGKGGSAMAVQADISAEANVISLFQQVDSTVGQRHRPDQQRGDPCIADAP